MSEKKEAADRRGCCEGFDRQDLRGEDLRCQVESTETGLVIRIESKDPEQKKALQVLAKCCARESPDCCR